VKRSPSGAKYLNHIFDRAQKLARHASICYVNCDIMLTSQFTDALRRVSSTHRLFLMAGRRWDTDITAPWDFSQPDWEASLSAIAHDRGKLQPPYSIDYFTFPRGMYREIPPLVIGRCWWDHWLVWKARSLGAPVVDATREVVAIHQNHDYSYHPEGFLGTLGGEEAMENYRLAGGRWHLETLEEATHRLTPDTEKYNWMHSFAPFKRHISYELRPVWFSLLNATRPIRHPLGLRQALLSRFRKRSAA
jgi:hypothetical protein